MGLKRPQPGRRTRARLAAETTHTGHAGRQTAQPTRGDRGALLRATSLPHGTRARAPHCKHDGN
eukprot:8307878-Lingulodinium_polyedra.AAC.1